MRLWQVYYTDPDDGNILVWASSQREAKAILRERKEELKDREDGEDAEPCGIQQVEVPTAKKGLIAWLNMHFNRDNE